MERCLLSQNRRVTPLAMSSLRFRWATNQKTRNSRESRNKQLLRYQSESADLSFVFLHGAQHVLGHLR